MFDTRFTDVFRAYEKHAAARAPDWGYAVTYVFRLVVTRWNQVLPDASGPGLIELVKRVGSVFAVAGELELYDLQAVTIQKVQPGETVEYVEPSAMDYLFGSPTRKQLAADEGTWVVDIVVRPWKVAENSSWRDGTHLLQGQDWLTYLSSVFSSTSTRGQSQAFYVGLVPMADDYVPVVADAPTSKAYVEQARAFWDARPAIWQITGKAEKDVGYVSSIVKINAVPPSMAWSRFPPYLGQDGLAFAWGSSMEPASLQPQPVASNASADVPGPVVPVVIVPDTPLQDFAPTNPWLKVAAVAVGTLGAYLIVRTIAGARTVRWGS